MSAPQGEPTAADGHKFPCCDGTLQGASTHRHEQRLPSDDPMVADNIHALHCGSW